MPLHTLPAPEPPAAPDTYAVEDDLTENYTTTAGTTGSDISLEMKMTWPTVDDVSIPRFLVVQPITAAWAITGTGITDAQAAWVCGMGGIYAELQCRVTGDSPLSTGDSSSHNVLRRAIRAPVFDTDTGIKYILGNYLDGDGDTMPAIEPQWIFGMGISAGFVTLNLHSQTYPSRRLAGLIGMVGGYGMDGIGTSPNDATDIVRDQLKFNYRDHKIATCAFLGGADTTLGSDRVEEFRTHLGTRADSIVHYDADGTHGGGWGTFDTSAITDADSEEEAVYNFIKKRCAVIQPTHIARRNFRSWERNWAKLQSRFW